MTDNLSPLTPATHTRLVTVTLTFTVDDTVTDDQIESLVTAAMVQIEEPYVPGDDPEALEDDYLGNAVQAQRAMHTVIPLTQTH